MRRSTFAAAVIVAAVFACVASFSSPARAGDASSADAWVFSGELAVVGAYGVVAANDVPAVEGHRLVPGLHLGANLRAGHVSFGLHAQWATLGLFDVGRLVEREYFATDLTMASFGPTIRVFPFGGDVAPFVGGGPNVQLIDYEPEYGSLGGTNAVTGPGFFGELGIELFRRGHVGAMAAIRVDVPLFSVEHRFADGRTQHRIDRYVVPVSLMIGMQFR